MSWPNVKLQNVCALLTDGTHYTPPDLGNGIPFLTVKDVSEKGLDFVNCSKISEDEYKKADAGNSAPKFGDVLFSKDGTVGKVHVVKEIERFAVLSSLAILRPSSELDSNYLGHALKSPLALNQATKSKTGSALRRIILSDLKNIKIPLPKLEEQKRIAAILDKADAIRRKRQEAIKLADDFLRALFLDMFGDPVTNPKNWKIKPLKQLGRSITGSTPPSQLDNMWGSEIPFATPGDLDGLLKTTVRNLTNEGAKKSRSCRKGSLLACCIGATIGKVSLAGVDTTFNQQINAQEWNNEINDDYGYFVFKLYPELIIKNAIKTTLPILKKSLFDEIEIPVPDIRLQNDFSKIVNAAWSIKDKYQSHKTDNLFESLSQKLFS